jgi:Innexin
VDNLGSACNSQFVLFFKVKDKNDHVKTDDFIDNYLRQDGVFLMRLLSASTNGLTAMELTAALWDRYFNKIEKRSPNARQSEVTNNNITRRHAVSNGNTDSSGLSDCNSVEIDDIS